MEQAQYFNRSMKDLREKYTVNANNFWLQVDLVPYKDHEKMFLDCIKTVSKYIPEPEK